jgi:hypothetical protein
MVRWSPGLACSVFSVDAKASNNASEEPRSTCSSSQGSRNWTGTVTRVAASTSASYAKNPPPKMAAVIRGSTAVSGTPIAVPSEMPPPYPIGASLPIDGSSWRASRVTRHSGTARSTSEVT